MRILKYIAILIIAFLLWFSFVIYGGLKGFWNSPIAKGDTIELFLEETEKKIEEGFVGNLAVSVLEDGKFSNDYYYSIGNPINKKTIFQMASVSKWITAWGVFSLVENEKINLDSPVDSYLKRWNLPPSPYNNEEVTIRKLLSHTSGLTDGLGYNGFAFTDSIQTIENSLTDTKDRMEGGKKVEIGIKPGSTYKYSGGGYTILQLLIEEISGQTFERYMNENVFSPLGMNRSTFILNDSLKPDLVTFYNEDASIAPHFRYTALAAASLYTCIDDLEKFVMAHYQENDVLSQETILQMIEPSAYVFSMPVHGLGPIIYSRSIKENCIIGHEGNNRNAINNSVRLDLKSKNGIIILETGNKNFASQLGSEWVFWRTGIVDPLLIISYWKRLIAIIGIGWSIIGLIFYYRIKFK